MEFDAQINEENYNDAELFAYNAGNDLDKWMPILGVNVQHNILGSGRIIQILESENKDNQFYIMVEFDHVTERKIRKFPPEAFRENRFIINNLGSYIPEWKEIRLVVIRDYRNILDQKRIEAQRALEEELEKKRIEEAQERRLAEELAQREKEEAASKHFSLLMDKYLINKKIKPDPTSPLYVILLKLEDAELLDQKEVVWLNHERIYSPLAFHYERKLIIHSAESWDIVNAGSVWRKAGHPERTLELTKSHTTNNVLLSSAILNTRGGAFRDLKMLPEAKECAIKARDLSPSSYHSYNLLGAISYQLGEPEEGDLYFELAKKNEAPDSEMDATIRQSVIDADKDAQITVARYLLHKDPQKYKWANYYLK